jgi:hypothetical protein
VRICDKYGGPDGQGFEVLDLLSQRKILQRKGHAVAIEVSEVFCQDIGARD